MPIPPELTNGLIDGYIFSATMQMRTPLRILLLHGQKWTGTSSPPPVEQLWHGIWIAALRGQKEFFGSMASEIGPIPADGGDYLQFLIDVRRVVEGVGSIETKTLLLDEVAQRWPSFIAARGLSGLLDYFFPYVIECIPGIKWTLVNALFNADMLTLRQISLASDAELLAIKGCGLSSLKKIRACIASGALPMDSDRLQVVDT